MTKATKLSISSANLSKRSGHLINSGVIQRILRQSNVLPLVIKLHPRLSAFKKLFPTRVDWLRAAVKSRWVTWKSRFKAQQIVGSKMQIWYFWLIFNGQNLTVCSPFWARSSRVLLHNRLLKRRHFPTRLWSATERNAGGCLYSSFANALHGRYKP